MVSLAICGLGNIGKVHLENLQSLRGCRVVGLFDRNLDELRRLAAIAGVKAYTNAGEVFADPETDAVVIATPTGSHREYLVRALEAGKHVFVEKPLAGTLADAEVIVRAAADSSRLAQVGFCERFNVNYLEAKRAVVQGRLGRIRAIQSFRMAPYAFSDPAWELGVLDTAVHNLDLILWFMGRAPRSVLARGAQVYQDSSIPHCVTTLLAFDDGSMATDQVSWVKDDRHPLHFCARSRMVLQGEEGMLEVDLSRRPSSITTGEGYRQLDTVILGGPEYYGCLKLQFEFFLRSIESGAPVMATVEEALLTERVALAAQASLRSGTEIALEAIR
ncbi:MAG: Gfo/Idh/MocA family oxidoreductase [Bryobacteraceae bacterium]